MCAAAVPLDEAQATGEMAVRLAAETKESRGAPESSETSLEAGERSVGVNQATGLDWEADPQWRAETPLAHWEPPLHQSTPLQEAREWTPALAERVIEWEEPVAAMLQAVRG